MQVLHRTEQGTQTLVEFYQALAHPLSRGKRMTVELVLLLLAEIETFAPGTVVWGVTSQDSVHLLSMQLHKDGAPESALPFVSISANMGGWHISCPMPPELTPWPDAIVSGYAETLPEAVYQVRLACLWAKLLPTT